MYIHEAISEITFEKPFITRCAWAYPTAAPATAVKIQPTDSPDGCVLLSVSRKNPCCGWHPTAGDLVADDWMIVAL